MNNKNPKDYRKCTKCKELKSLTSENFHKAKDRYLGFDYRCKQCSSLRKDNRRERYKNMSYEQKQECHKRDRKYRKTIKGRALVLYTSCRTVDKIKNRYFDLDKEFILETILSDSAECIYCGTKERLGCERIDNKKGHSKDNVVPACPECNIARMDNFTHEEMFIIGAAIRKVRELRKYNETI